MLKKRLVGVITVKDGWAVQSFGYHRYLPLGKPEVLAENLDRWGADEIILQCIDRSRNSAGPDYQTLSKLARKGLGTPIIYGGGIASVGEGMRVIQSGADRIIIDALLFDAPGRIIEFTHRLGAQALIAALPVSYTDHLLHWYNYRTTKYQPLSESILTVFRERLISEVMLVDHLHEGEEGGFQLELIRNFPLIDVPVIAFGGLSTIAKMREVLSLDTVSAVALGNFLNYKEHSIYAYKKELSGLSIRMNYIDGC